MLTVTLWVERRAGTDSWSIHLATVAKENKVLQGSIKEVMIGQAVIVLYHLIKGDDAPFIVKWGVS